MEYIANDEVGESLPHFFTPYIHRYKYFAVLDRDSKKIYIFVS